MSLLLTGAGPATPGGFSPLSLSLAAWYDASQETPVSDGTAILPHDFSGNARHQTQATGSKQPLYKTAIQGGKPIFRGDGVDDSTVASFALTQPYTTFAVIKQRAIGGTANPIMFQGANAGAGLLYSSTGTSIWNIYAGINVSLGDQGTTLFHRLAVVWNGASSSYQIDDAALVTPVNLSTAVPGGIALFANSDGSQSAPCDIAEMFCSPSVKTPTEIAAAMTYLKTKWGL